MNKQVFNFNFSVSVSVYNRNTDKANILKYKEINGDIFLLAEYIKNGYAYTNCFYHDVELFSNREKSSNNIKSANIISIDLDAVKYTYEDFINLMEQTEINPNIVYTTANNGKRKKDEKFTNRYRVIYITDKPIYNNNLYCNIQQNIKKEIELITEDRNIFNDNTDKSISHFFAGNINTNLIIDNNIYSLKWLTDRYNINEENTHVNIIKSSKNLNTNKQSDNTSKKGYISKLITNKIEYIKSIIQLNNKKEEESIIQMYDTFSEIENNEFINDYYIMSISQLINKYIRVYKSIECTQLEYDEITPFLYLPSDYTEIKRKGGYLKIDINGNIINTQRIHKIKDGEGRRKTLFTNLLLRRQIYPNISFCHLLFNAVFELYYYIDNVNFKDGIEDKITKYELAEIAVNAYFADIRINNTEQRKYKVNDIYCIKHNITKRQCNMKKLNDDRNTRKEEIKNLMRKLYDNNLKDDENLKVLNDYLNKSISIATFKRYKKEMGLYKNKQIKCTNMAKDNKKTENANNKPISAHNGLTDIFTTENNTEQHRANKCPFRLNCYNVPKFSNI